MWKSAIAVVLKGLTMSRDDRRFGFSSTLYALSSHIRGGCLARRFVHFSRSFFSRSERFAFTVFCPGRRCPRVRSHISLYLMFYFLICVKIKRALSIVFFCSRKTFDSSFFGAVIRVSACLWTVAWAEPTRTENCHEARIILT